MSGTTSGTPKLKILGIAHDVYICSAAVVVDGEVVSAIPEERLDRKKQSRVFPSLAIDRCVREAGLTIHDIDEIAVAWNPAIEIQSTPAGYLDARRWRTEHLAQVPARLAAILGTPPNGEMTLTNLAEGAPPVTFVDHYHAHLGNALSVCPDDPVAFLVMDGRGETLTDQAGIFSGSRVEVTSEVHYPHSLGLFYGMVTQFLGFKPDSDEWKVMALASYADPMGDTYDRLSKLITVEEDGTFRLALEYFEHYNFFDRRLYSDVFVEEFGPPRRAGEVVTDRDEALAAAMQRVFEETVTKILAVLHERSGLDSVILSGGSFMNSVFNGKATELTPFSRCYISGSPDDSGTSIGAALFLHNLRTGSRPALSSHNSWGPQYTDDDCLDVARRYKLPGAEVVDDPSRRAAQELADGRIVGWFQGRMEFGQRALGNRSILLDPRRSDGRDLLNQAVKFREAFRPFAPAILAERVSDYFECPEDARVPFMERVYMFRPEKRAEVPSVVHVDGSGRLQTVTREDNPRYYELISHFEGLTGVPIVLNTSFNLNGEPIVCSPEDAIRTFMTCGLDTLYLGNVRIPKQA
ncbi:MAG: carbamoyltransferase C-terminal domain-containing protein [Actinomycetota bacterium]